MRRKYTISIFLVFLSLLISCTTDIKEPILKKETAVLTGKVSNFHEGKKAIRFMVGGTIQRIEQIVILDSIGYFQTQFELLHPQEISFTYKNINSVIYLRPADSLHIEIDESISINQREPLYTITGNSKDAIISQNIRDYLRYRGDALFTPNAEGTSAAEFLTILKKEIILRDSVLKVFCNKNKVLPEFREWAKNDIKYGVANYLLDYRIAHQEKYDGSVFDKSLFPVDNDAAITNSLYGYHLMHYAYNLGLWQDSISMKLLAEENVISAYHRCFDKIIVCEAEGLSRDIMCFKLMLNLFDHSTNDYLTLYKTINQYINNQLIVDILNEKMHEIENQEDIDIAFLDPESKELEIANGDFWKAMKAKYEGKVIYIDIWATWCGPCRGEIPHAIELHDYFKDSDIAFVNLCLASNKSEWEKIIVNYNINGENYFFNELQTQLLRDKLKFTGYPTYLIIDKEGKLIYKVAPRPSSGEKIRSMLSKLIDD